MKKVLFVAFMVMAFLALGSLAAFACGGDKASTASAKSADCSAKTTDAKLTSEKSGCSASKATATMASSKTTGDKAACTAAEKAACAAKLAAGQCSIEECLKACEAKHAELCGAEGHGHTLTAMSIKGMTCGGCETSVKTALMAVEGVTNVIDVCHKAGFAVVCTNKADFKSDVLVRTVAAKGFESEIIPAVAVTTTDTKTENAECSAHKKVGSN